MFYCTRVIGLVLALGGLAQAPAGEAQLLRAKDWSLGKVGTQLAELHHEFQAYQNQAGLLRMLRPFGSPNPTLPVREDRVIIDAVAAGDPRTLQADLEALGMTGAVRAGQLVSGELPLETINNLLFLNSLQFARPAAAITAAGSVTSQGVTALQVDLARLLFKVDGKGVSVGVLSDSYNCRRGAAADVASGDLPPGIVVLWDEPACSSGSDEGRAMMQLIHDVAPGAAQAFHTAFAGQAGFAAGILRLAEEAGATVIVDDVYYFDEPMFQDGVVAQAVDQAKGAGVAYFSAAGNQARRAYEAPYRPSGRPGWYGERHDFDPSAGTDIYQKITVPVGTGVVIALQWDSPYFSVCGSTGCPGGAPNDLDILLYSDPPDKQQITDSMNINLGGDPTESLYFLNDGRFDVDRDGKPDTAFNIAIEKYAGPAPALMKYVVFRVAGSDYPRIEEYDTSSGSIYGHANAAGAVAVGAAFFAETPAFGVNPPLLEPFSGAGPTPILFDIQGNAINEIRWKPEIVAPDKVNTTFFGRDIDYPLAGEPDGFPNFSGTSAAAPHAAAVAALLYEHSPHLTPTHIRTALERTAFDMGAPGFDFDSGYGLIQAERVLCDANGDCAAGGGSPAEAPVLSPLGLVILAGLLGLLRVRQPRRRITAQNDQPNIKLIY